MIEEVFRDAWPQVVGSLARRFGDLDLAEDAAGEAVVVAVQHWGSDGLPPNPTGWLMTTATRKAIDRIRREARGRVKEQEAQMLDDPGPDPYAERVEASPIEDDTLRLMFVCCHPAIAPAARVALTLRLVAGLTVPEIARGFLVQEATMGQRITRAKSKIKANRIRFDIPDRGDLPTRLGAVLHVVYLVFNEGYLAGEGEDPIRADLTDEAIRLGRLLRALMPGDGEVAGLLALMLLTDARRASRVSVDGELVRLDEQDRGGWDAGLIAEGHALVRERIAASTRGEPVGVYQLQAAINAVHTDARDIRDTDWTQLAVLYDQLYALQPSPVVALNRAVVAAELDGPEVALAAVDRLPLDGYHAFHAARADLLRRLGRSDQARAAYDRAIELAGNPAEIKHLTRRRGELAP